MPPRLEQGTISLLLQGGRGSSQKEAWVACEGDSVSGGLSFGHQGWRETARPSCAILQRLALIDMTCNLTESCYNLIGRKTWEQVKKRDAINLLDFQDLNLSWHLFCPLRCPWLSLTMHLKALASRPSKIRKAWSIRIRPIFNNQESHRFNIWLLTIENASEVMAFLQFYQCTRSRIWNKSLELKWSMRYKWMQLDLHRYQKFERSQND